MYYYEVAPNQIFRSEKDLLTYSSDTILNTGQIVLIEIGKKSAIGIVIKKTSKPIYQTKQITKIIEEKPLPKQLTDLAFWISKYYLTPLASVVNLLIPSGIQKKRRSQEYNQNIAKRKRTNNLLNHGQQMIMAQLSEHPTGTFLLHGITGSGKTEIYINLAKQAISDNKSAIILVPEIALTPQLLSEFSNHFTNLLVTHSKMTESARHIVWSKALNSPSPLVVIGPRSALFAPLKDIGLIVIDEAHEPSYKQEVSPKYSALRVATILGRLHQAKVVFGSATPNIVDKFLAEKSDKPVLRLDKTANPDNKPSTTSVINMTDRSNFSRHRFISNQLLDKMTETLKDGNQVLIFHNRRGSTSTTLCEDCGWTSICPKCFLPMSLHADKHLLICHICNFRTDIPMQCPTCNNTNIIHKGIGTKLVESELIRLFPNKKIARFDTDTDNEQSMDSLYHKLYSGEIDIIIGTQTITKGLDLPKLRLVGIIQADAGLSLPDYSTNERTYQLIAQVVGRVGRNKYRTQVIIQTYQPSHPSIYYGLNQDYDSFYKYSLNERKKGGFPPYSYLLKLVCVYKTEASAIKNSQIIAKKLGESIGDKVRILGPTPAFYERQNGTYRWQLTLKSSKREYLIEAIKIIPPNNWQYELDPTSLL